MNVKSTLIFAVFGALIAFCNTSPLLSSSEEVSLSEVLRKANILLDRLLAQTDNGASQTRGDNDQQDFELQLNERYNPDKHRQTSNHVETRNEDGPVPYAHKSAKNEEGPVPYVHRSRYAHSRAAQTEDGPVPYISRTRLASSTNDVDEDPVDEVSLKDAIRWLQELREQRKTHHD